MAAVDSRPWLCIGDYNDILNPEEKRGRGEHHNWLFRGFQEAIEDSNLTDLALSGYKCMWFKSKGAMDAVEERLDRAMHNLSWVRCFLRQGS